MSTTPGRQLFAEPLNVKLLATSAGAGALAWTLSVGVYDKLRDVATGPQVIAALFLALYVLVALVVALGGVASRTCPSDVFRGRHALIKHMLSFLALGLLLFFLSFVFEYIYEQEVGSEREAPTSLVFLTDNSGSMLYNDPSGIRWTSIVSAAGVSIGEVPCMVYRFSDQVELVRSMAPAASGESIEPCAADGKTAMLSAFERAIEDYEADTPNYGTNPRIVLLSDGVPTDATQEELLASMVPTLSEKGISVSAVGLGTDDDEFMRRLAALTGGTYLRASDVEELEGDMVRAAHESARRTLLSERGYLQDDWMYAAMRIGFLFVLGMLLGGSMVIMYGRKPSARTILISSLVTSFVGAMLMEWLCAQGFPPNNAWLLLWILLAVTIASRQRISRFSLGELKKRSLGRSRKI